MSFDTITVDNIQQYFQYLENVKALVFEPILVNGTHLNAVVHTDPDFLKLNLPDGSLLEKIFQRLLFLCDEVSNKNYDIQKYDVMLAVYFLILKSKIPNNVMHNMSGRLKSIGHGFWTNLIFNGDFYGYRATTDEGRDSGSTIENQISETSSAIS